MRLIRVLLSGFIIIWFYGVANAIDWVQVAEGKQGDYDLKGYVDVDSIKKVGSIIHVNVKVELTGVGGGIGGAMRGWRKLTSYGEWQIKCNPPLAKVTGWIEENGKITKKIFEDWHTPPKGFWGMQVIEQLCSES